MIELSQQEADALIQIEKSKIDNKIWGFPSPGDSIEIPLVSLDKKLKFILDIERGKIALKKAKYQNRAFQIFPLVRVDVGGAPHRNPDDTEVPSPHIHVYREGYGDKWAYPLPVQDFPQPDDLWATLYDFFQFCNIIEPPDFQNSLF